MEYNQLNLEFCPICKQENIEKIISENYVLNTEKKQILLDFFYCHNCDFVFQKNPLDFDSIKEYYSNVASRYRNSESTKTKIELREKQINFILDNFSSNINNILEIGADDGGFLTLCKNRWNAETYFDELNDKACQILLSKGHKEKQYNYFYDLVVLLQVFEHIINPLDFLINLKNILNDNALVLIEVPNHTFWDDYDYTFSLEHTNYFSSKSLTKLISDADFSIINWTITTEEHYLNNTKRIIRCLLHYSKKEKNTTLIKNHFEINKISKFNSLNDYLVSNSSNINIGLYGIGEVVRSLNSMYELPKDISLFDSDISKYNTVFSGIKINKPENILTENIEEIIVTCNLYKEVVENLNNIGFTGKITFWINV